MSRLIHQHLIRLELLSNKYYETSRNKKKNLPLKRYDHAKNIRTIKDSKRN